MKIKYLIGTLGLSLALGLGVGAGLSAQNNGVAKKAEAATAPANSKIYLKTSWTDDTSFFDYGQRALYNHADGKFYEFTYDSTSGLHVCTLEAASSSFNLFRGSSLNWDNKWGQSSNASFDDNKNLIIVTGYTQGGYWDGSKNVDRIDFEWSQYEGDFVADKTGELYFRTPNLKSNYYVYTYESYNVNGIDVVIEANGGWLEKQLSTTTKTKYNPGNVSSDSLGIIKVEFDYKDLTKVGVIVIGKQYIDSDYEFKTKDLVASPSGTKQAQLTLGAYYYTADDWDLYDNLVVNSEMGYDASVAYELDKVNICALPSAEAADALRTRMEENNGYLVDATWDLTHNYTYEQALRLVDSQCTVKKYQSSSKVLPIESNQGNNTISIAIIISLLAIASIGGFFLLKKKKAI
jgi:hypothetical protein